MFKTRQPIYRIVAESLVSYDTIYMTDFATEPSRAEQAEQALACLSREVVSMTLVRDKSEQKTAVEWMQFSVRVEPKLGREPISVNPTNSVLK